MNLLCLLLVGLLFASPSVADAGWNEIAVNHNSASADAFARLRTSEVLTLFDSKKLLDDGSLIWDTYKTGTADTNYSAASLCTLHVGAAGDTLIRQTFTRWNYQPGKSQLFLMTGVMRQGATGTGVTSRIGAFDQSNGVFFEYADTTASVVVRNLGSDAEKITRANWNIDRMDGNGRSGVTLDFSKTQIFYVDYEWLGVGRVRFGVVVAGEPIIVHEALHANTGTSTYMATPNQPVRYEITTTGVAANMVQICSSVMSEGGLDGFGYTFRGSSPVAGYVASTVDLDYAVLGIRLKAAGLDAMVKPLSVSFLMETATSGEFFWARNPTIANIFTCADVKNSAVQLCTGTGGGTPSTVTAGSWDLTYGGGHILSSGTGGNGRGTGSALDFSNMFLGSTIAGVPDTLVLIMRTYDATATAHAQITWQELR